MFNLFKKTSQADKLNKQYKKLLEEAFKLSSTNRQVSDAKMAEAEKIGQQLAEMRDS